MIIWDNGKIYLIGEDAEKEAIKYANELKKILEQVEKDLKEVKKI